MRSLDSVAHVNVYRTMKLRTIIVLPVLFLVLSVVPTKCSDNIRTKRRVKYSEDRVKKSLDHSHSHSERRSPEEELRILRKIYSMFNDEASSPHHRSKKDSYTSHHKHDHHPSSYKEEESHHAPHKKNSYTQHPLDPRGIYEPVHTEDSSSYQHEYESKSHYKSSKHHHTPIHENYDDIYYDAYPNIPQHHSNHHTSSSHHDKYTKESTDYYQFGFQVNNDKNVSHGHMEFEKGGKKVGQYKIQLPDGRLQVVSYEADAYGFRPIVRFIEPKGYKEPVHPKKVITAFKNVVQTTKRPITTTVTTVVPSTTTISTTTPSIAPKYKNEKKGNQNIIVIQLPDSYNKKGQYDDRLQSTVYDIVDKLTNYYPKRPVTFGKNDHLKPKIERSIHKPDISKIRKRPSIRFSDPPSYKSFELTAENRHPIGVYHPDYIYSDRGRVYDYEYDLPGDYLYQEEPISQDYYISVDKEESDPSPIYVLARRKDDKHYHNF